LAGLLHDLGLLIHLQVNSEKLEAVCTNVHDQLAHGSRAVNFCAVERKLIGVDHEQLGEALAKHWGLSEMLQQVIAFHHHPKSELGGNRDMVALVHLADTLVCRGPGFNLTACTQVLDPAEMKHAGLDEEKLDAVSDALPALIDGAAAIFD
jgi:HD-like signal output (HDOD) protein